MNLCSDGHDEVCYEGRNCPACEQIQERETEVDKLMGEIEELKAEIQQLESEGAG